MLAYNIELNNVSECFFFQGGTLQDRIDRGQYLNQIDLLRILVDVCQAVKALHCSTPKLAHRFVKYTEKVPSVNNTATPSYTSLLSDNFIQHVICKKSDSI